MRPLRYILFIVATTLSPIILLGLTAEWVDSHFNQTRALYRWPAPAGSAFSQRTVGLYIEPDKIVLTFANDSFAKAIPPPLLTRDGFLRKPGIDPYFTKLVGTRFGFGVLHDNLDPTYDEWVLVLPFWFIILCAGFLAAWCFTSYRKSRRTDTGVLCATCGYDLRASTDRCPECGTSFPAKIKGRIESDAG